MTKAELLTYAEDNNIEGVTSSMTKAEILAAIQAAESGEDPATNTETP